MQEAHKHDDSVHEGISFHGFMRMLAVTRSMDNLDQVTMLVLLSHCFFHLLRGRCLCAHMQYCLKMTNEAASPLLTCLSTPHSHKSCKLPALIGFDAVCSMTTSCPPVRALMTG